MVTVGSVFDLPFFGSSIVLVTTTAGFGYLYTINWTSTLFFAETTDLTFFASANNSIVEHFLLNSFFERQC